MVDIDWHNIDIISLNVDARLGSYTPVILVRMPMLSRLIPILILLSSSALAEELMVERLTWAGVKIASPKTTVFVDAVGTDLWNGNAPGGLVPVESDTGRTYALITHTHNDHFDEATLKRVLGEKGYVVCHRDIATHIASRGLRVIPADEFVPVSRGGFTFIAVPAEDGFGSPQVSWVVRHNKSGSQYLHAGDTLWHGSWPIISEHYGEFDAVFLPINAPVVGGDPQSEVPAVMGPHQAVDAAVLLKAKTLVPIHYGFTGDAGYVEEVDALGKLEAQAKRRKVKLSILEPGELLDSTD